MKWKTKQDQENQKLIGWVLGFGGQITATNIWHKEQDNMIILGIKVNITNVTKVKKIRKVMKRYSEA